MNPNDYQNFKIEVNKVKIPCEGWNIENLRRKIDSGDTFSLTRKKAPMHFHFDGKVIYMGVHDEKSATQWVFDYFLTAERKMKLDDI
jgi:hypothetical protein